MTWPGFFVVGPGRERGVLIVVVVVDDHNAAMMVLVRLVLATNDHDPAMVIANSIAVSVAIPIADSDRHAAFLRQHQRPLALRRPRHYRAAQ
jgi:hypothetical protein